jgi:hypothetical protein
LTNGNEPQRESNRKKMAARNLLSSLGDDAVNEVYKFIRFFDNKKENVLKMISSEFDEAVEMMDETEYRREEVYHIFSRFFSPHHFTNSHLFIKENTDNTTTIFFKFNYHLKKTRSLTMFLHPYDKAFVKP